MSKAIIWQECNNAQQNNYVWQLFYFRINRKRNNPYMTYKVRFRNETYLTEYANNLLSAVLHFQLQEVTEVQEYNGENAKISCDKLALSDVLIKDEWEKMYSAIVNPLEDKFKGNVQGYLLTGKPVSGEGKSITFFKCGNPVVKLSNNKAHFYSCVQEQLDLVTDEFCRLYLNTDFIVLNGVLYTFNLNFEKVFNLEKTTAKIKEQSVEAIISTNCISDVSVFKRYAQEYKSTRTFITLNQERLLRVQDVANRKEISDMLNFQLDDNKNFILDSAEKTSVLLRFLCYKIIKEAETNDVMEVSNMSKLEL